MSGWLRRRLGEPYPADFGSRALVTSSLVSGIFVALFFFFIQPFGLGALAARLTLPLYLGYGAITSALVALNHVIVPRIFSRACCDEGWNVGRQVLFSTWVTLTIAVAAYFFTRIYSRRQGLVLGGASFGLVLLATFLIGGLLSLLYILLDQNRALRRNLRLESAANARFDARPAPPAKAAAAPQVVLVAENGRDTFKADLANLLFIAAEENYVEIFFLRDKVERALLRSSLTRIERQLRDFKPRLFRCHRAYIVNVDQIRKVAGNAQGFKLTLRDTAATVPVARRYIPEFRRIVAANS